jgi:hypothetical protein
MNPWIPWTARMLCSLLLTFREPHCPGPLLGREKTIASGVPRLGHVIRGASLSSLSLTSLIHETAVAIFVTVGHGVVQLPHQVPSRTILPRGEAHELFHWKQKTINVCAECSVVCVPLFVLSALWCVSHWKFNVIFNTVYTYRDTITHILAEQKLSN